MPIVSLVGIDTAGGVVTGPGSSVLKVNGSPVVQVGDAVASHGSGPHQGAKIAAGSTILRTNGIPVSYAGDAATCGDQLTGSSIMTVSA